MRRSWRSRTGLALAPLLVCGLAGVLLGLGSFTFRYAAGGSYFSNDPRACANCHIMRDVYDSWQKASHHAVATCNDCHTPQDFLGKYLSKAENGFRHSMAFTLQNFEEPIRIKPKNARILQANCLTCHADLVGDIRGHGAAEDDAPSCVRCHSAVGHGPSR